MRIIIFFDLPTLTSEDLREYRKFRQFLIKNGFSMMQESVYSKLVINNNSSVLVVKKINDNLPKNGLVQMLTVTEKQFANIKYLKGNAQGKIIDSQERLVILWN